MVKIINDNYMYARVVKFIGSRKDFTEDKLSALEEIVMDESKAKTIYEATKVSMGIFDLIYLSLFFVLINLSIFENVSLMLRQNCSQFGKK